MTLKPILLLSALTILAGGAAAQPPAMTPTYSMTMTLSEGDRVIATPRLSLASNSPTEVDIGEPDGSRYQMRFTIVPQSAQLLTFRSTVRVTSASSGETEGRPVLLVKLGETAAVELGRDGPTQKPFRVTFQIQSLAPAT